MRAEREAMDATSFSVEYMTVGIWPDDGSSAGGPVSLDAWRELADEESGVDAEEPIPELALGFDMSNQRQVSICVVGRRDDGLLHLDFAGRYEGAGAAAAAIVAIYERPDVDVRVIVCDGEPQNMDLLARLRRELVPESALRREGAARVGVQSCGALVDLVAEGRFRHRGQWEIEEALRGAVVKTFSDSWAYSRSRSRSDVSPLLAAAAALWVADAELAVAAGGINIY